MKKNTYGCLVFIFCFCLVTQVDAQGKPSKYIPDSERFSAGLILGYNSAQIDGDYQIGFDKFGITGGLRGIARITPRLDFNIEMLYSKKGSKIFPPRAQILVNPKKDRIIDLTYVDAPIFFKWLLKKEASIWHIELGGIYSRLIDSEITEEIRDASREFVYQDAVADFDKDDISVLAGFGYTWQKGFALNLRYSISVNKFYKNPDFQSFNPGGVVVKDVQFLRNYHYSLSISYTIFKRAIKGKRK